MRTLIPRRLDLFWQIVLAFVVTSFVISVGLFLSSRSAFWRLEADLQSSASLEAGLWQHYLARYYETQLGWEGVEAMIAAYSLGETWETSEEAPQFGVVLADSEGRIVIAQEAERVGTLLRASEQAWSLPIEHEGEAIGYLLLPFTASLLQEGFPEYLWSERPLFIRRALERFLITQVVVIAIGLLIGAVLSRGIARPMADLTTATHAIAAGDLSTRVRESYPGELGDLAASFNRMASALEQANEARRTMTADVADELQKPLSAIRASVETILAGPFPATPDCLAPVLEEAEMLSQLVEDLHVLLLAEGGQLWLTMQLFEVDDVLHDTWASFAERATLCGIELVVDVPVALPPVEADWARISQVLGNLVTNALRHTPEGGTITLSARPGDVRMKPDAVGMIPASWQDLQTESGEAAASVGYAMGTQGTLPALPDTTPSWDRASAHWGHVLTDWGHTPADGDRAPAEWHLAQVVTVFVANTGDGIPAEELPHIFERFWRYDPASERLGSREGSGLGLAIARELLALHGSTLAVESVVGAGTVFSFVLPEAEGQRRR